MTPPEASADPRVARSRAAVIGAALELLATGGYAAVTIDALSKQSGVARTTIYRHWASVAEIVQEAATSTLSQYAVPNTGDVRTDLRAHIGALANKLTNTDWGRMLPLIVDAAGRDADMLALQRSSTAERRAAAMSIVTAGVERGVIRPDADVDLVGEMLVGAIFTRHLVTHQPITDEFLDELIAIVWTLIGIDRPD